MEDLENNNNNINKKNKKVFAIVMLIILILGITLMAILAYGAPSDDSFEAYTLYRDPGKYYFNTLNTLYSIEQCEGPVKVRISSYYDLQDNEIIISSQEVDKLEIKNCSKQSNYVWTCECDDSVRSLDIKFQVSSSYFNAYNFVVLYYIDYFKVNDVSSNEDINSTNSVNSEVNQTIGLPSKEQIRLENNQRSKEIKGVMLRDPLKIFNYDITANMKKVVMIIFVIFCIGATIAFKIFQKKMGATDDTHYNSIPSGIEGIKDLDKIKSNNLDEDDRNIFNYSTSTTDNKFDAILKVMKDKQKKDADRAKSNKSLEEDLDDILKK
jgi:hypothetical protein